MAAKENYAKKLSDPRWQQKRLLIFQRDNWTCQHCQDKTTQLEIHHTEYFEGKEPWEYSDDMLITVCHRCHKEEMVRFKHEAYLLKAFVSTGFLANDLLALSTMLNTHIKFRETLLKNIRQYANS
jgi:5-methylcytosine-specific restriction endonuclease McrA